MQLESQEKNDDIDDHPIRGTILLYDICERCNVALMEPSGYEETTTNKKWILAMKKELNMIEKKSDMRAGGQTRKQEAYRSQVGL